MKFSKIMLVLTLAAAMTIGLMAGCSDKDGDTTTTTTTTAGETTAAGEDSDAAEASTFDYSAGLDENGYWKGVKALDFVTLCDYKNIEIANDVHNITDEALNEEIDGLLSSYSTPEEITDRAVADGDTVNIDYVGSVDGVEFEGGSTGGNGTEVTIGVTQYIDDFLEQLIGHEAGETFDINVTFPEDYGNETLNGKDAVFVTTVNHIVGTKIPELNDEFVSSNFAESNSWNTVEDLNEGVRTHLKDSAVSLYLQEFILENCEVASIPESLMTYQEEAMMAYYEDYAASYSMSVDDFLTSYLGVESADALLVQNKAQNEEQAKFYLVVQAIAEDAEIALSDDEVKEFFLEQYSEEEYTQLESEAGLPYMKMIVMNEKVLEELENNAKLA